NIIKDPASAVSDWVKSSGMAVSQEALAKRNLPKDASAKPPFGQSTTQTATPEEIKRNTGPSRELTEAEISSFEAPDFNFGEIPEMPPTIALRQG
ncbi:hypothetical protein EC988_007947, partial [Linderina pennispora]